MSLRRGFKAEANRISLSLRRDLGLPSHAPIDLFALAERLRAIVVPLSAFSNELPNEVRHLLRVETGAFSAATVPLPSGRRVIIFNDGHSIGRRNSNLAHEIAHLALGHEFTLPIDTTGCRVIDRDVEDEANWLGPTILISNEAAIHILRRAMDDEATCREYGVTSAVLRMRINASGARIRINRSYN
jgi:IrrE N-terminal-like domain